VGGSKNVISLSIKYAKERKAFGTTISQFGMIQHKLAEMAIRTFAAESMSYRVWTDRGVARGLLLVAADARG